MSKQYWHRFDQRLSDEQIRAAVASIGLEATEVIREAGVVFIEADGDRRDEIGRLLGRVDVIV